MTLNVTHTFVSAIPDDPVAAAAGEVLTQSHWNATHTVTGTVGPSIGARTILTAALTNYYVRTDGSDSNSGLVDSAGGAWATIQHAYNFIGLQLDFGGNSIQIKVGIGTFPLTPAPSPTAVVIPGTTGGGLLALDGAGSASTKLDVVGQATYFQTAGTCTAEIGFNSVAFIDSVGGGYTFDCFDFFTSGLNMVIGSLLLPNNTDILFQPNNAGPGTGILDLGGQIFVTIFAGTITIDASLQAGANISPIDMFNGVQCQAFHNWVFLNNPNWGTGGSAGFFFLGYESAYVQLQHGTITGASTGAAYTVEGASVLSVHNFPGTSGGICDNISSVQPGSFSDEALVGVSKISGLPSTTQLPFDGLAGLFKDTSGGGVYWAYNDGGTIKKVALT